MYFFAPKYKTFDKYDKEKIKREISAAYSFGMAGNDKNEPVAALRAKVAADISALERTVQVFNYVPGSDGLHKHIRDHLVQDRKWLVHYDKCLEQTKKGFEQLKINSKALRHEAFKAGEISAEKALTLRIEAEKAKQKAQQEQNKNKTDQEKKIQDGNNQNKNRDNQDKNRDNNRGKDHNNKQVVVVERMVVQEVVGKKKDKKDKGPKFYTLKPS